MSSSTASHVSSPAHRVQPHHFHAGSNPAAAPASADKLYRHALESVFAFCGVKELLGVSRLSSTWRQATLTMRPLEWQYVLNSHSRAVGIGRSTLMRRHIADLRLSKEAANPGMLMCVALNMPHLKVLKAELSTPSEAALCFPSQLQKLILTLPDGFTPEAVVRAIEEIGRLQQLISFTLTLPGPDDAALSFAPLSRMPTLRTLLIGSHDAWDTFDEFSAEQIEQLRSVSTLTTFRLNNWGRVVLDPRRLLAFPHRWQQLQSLLGWVDMDDELGMLVQHLPELTKLEFAIADASCTHVDWLAQLPKLTTLGVLMLEEGSTDVPRVMAALQQCTGLTTLQLRGGEEEANNFFTVEQLDSLLQHLPNLRDLTLSYTLQVTSLSFLSRVSSTLTSLTLQECSQRIPARELKRITSTKQLTTVRIQHDVFDRQLTDLEVDFMQPPSLLMPSLREFKYAADIDA